MVGVIKMKRIFNKRLLTTYAVILAIGYFYFKDSLITTSVASSALLFGLPLAMAAMVGILCERTGIVNIGIEGTLLFSAFLGFFVSAITENLLMGLTLALVGGILMSLLLGLLTVNWKMDQIIAGTIVNILAAGLTSFFYKQGYALPAIFPTWEIPVLSEIPFFGPILFIHGPLTYAGLILILALWVGLFHTSWGLRSRAVGEHPGSADAAGISVAKLRYLNLTLAGAFGGLTGAYLSLELVGSFDRGFSAGKGFTALALMIFGRWNPLGALGASIFFGTAQALANQLMINGVVNIPQPFINMLPYVLTIIVLALSAGKVRPPAAAGQPYEKEST